MGYPFFSWPLLNDLWVGSPDHIPWRIKSTQSTQPYFNICKIYLYHEFWFCTITLCCLLKEYCKYVHIIMCIYIYIYIQHHVLQYGLLCFTNKKQMCTTFAGRVRSSTFVLHYGEAGHGGSLKKHGWYKELRLMEEIMHHLGCPKRS